MLIEQRMTELGLVLPDVPMPSDTFLPFVQIGNLLFVSGQGPLLPGGGYAVGKLGGDVTVEEGYRRARTTGLVMIAIMQRALGDLDRVVRIGKLLGMVNCVPEFGDPPKVINGCSDLLLDVFGERGRHARSAVGMASLPGNMTVEIEAVVEVAAA